MSRHETLRVWQDSMRLIAECYQRSAVFPPTERFGLTLQMRRAAISVASNIAEGNGRLHRREQLHHLSYASGSLAEVATHIAVAVMLGYLSNADVEDLRRMAGEIGRQLTALRRNVPKDWTANAPS
jgi:four helix bundle protein